MENFYNLTEDQLSLQEMVRDFARKELAPVVAECDVKGEFPMDVYKKIVEIGVNAMFIPEELGGLGLDQKTICVIREELGRVDTGFAITVGSSALAYTPVSLAGTEAQKKMIAEHIVNGGFAAYALTEPDGGSDAGHPHTTARKAGDEWVINGRKCFITNAPFANIFVVFACTDPTQGSRGVTAFLVERDREGVSIGAHENKMGIRLSQTSDVVFDDVHVPADHMLGAEGAGFKIAMNTLNITRPAGSATVVGLMQNCVDLCVKYAKERVVFGKPISKFQAVQFMIADMQTKTMAARLMVHHAADCIDRGIASPVVGACTKCYCGDAAVEVASDAIQVYGGYGYSRDYPVEKLLRDAKIYQIFEGTNQIQRMTIAGNLLK
ncbi:MAG: acyl-CoA dehydrogenase [Lachnospiraceae bacterium]|jgi:alkylation response protein AidB-like acyl-CoA dehydrogenase|nr:acyl-CoA dehydrogenase [Lachnospiraceae bacterium]MCI8958117.1 acyl-CoA dehydrogenase [Lachnospiraceae bacterium]